MMLNHLFRAGSTSLQRGPRGVLLATAAATLLWPTLLLLVDWAQQAVHGSWHVRDLAEGAMIPGGFFLAALLRQSSAAVVLGVPMWLCLRRLKWESGWLYALGGICGGLVINAVVQGEVWDR